MKPLRFLLISLFGAVLHTAFIYMLLKSETERFMALSTVTSTSPHDVIASIVASFFLILGYTFLTITVTFVIGAIHGAVLLTALILSLTWLKSTSIIVGDFLIKKDSLFLNILRAVGYLTACLVLAITIDILGPAKNGSWSMIAMLVMTVIMDVVYINWLVAVGKRIQRHICDHQRLSAVHQHGT